MTVKSKRKNQKTAPGAQTKKRASRSFYYPMTPKEHTKIVALIGDALIPQCGCYADVLRNSTPLDIIKLRIDYTLVDVFEAAAIRQFMALYQKDASLSIEGIDKELVAVEKFVKTEIECRKTNARLRGLVEADYLCGGAKHSTDMSNPVYQFIQTCAELIRLILGECPDYSDIPFKFGPGSSTTVRDRTTVPFKLLAVPVSAKEAILSGAVDKLIATVPRLKQIYAHNGQSVRFGMGHLNFVPKNAVGHRTMIIEPVLNTAAQIGIGTILKERFKKSVGVDLKKQWQVNMELARVSSAISTVGRDQRATVDFSSASDLISYYLVMLLLPLSWFNLLSDWRTGTVCYKKGRVASYELEKFSSMGNGYTFELESIIFYAMGLAVIGRKNQVYDPQVIIDRFSNEVSIFGDDLIVPSSYYPGILWASKALGFKINQDKTYTKGPFRESCGGDYLNGIQIRPFYVKDVFTSARIVGLLNHDLRNSFGGLLPEETRAQLISYIPTRDRLFGLDGYGDGHIVVHNPSVVRFDKLSLVTLPVYSFGPVSFRLRDGTNRFFFETLKKANVSHPIDNEVLTYIVKMYETQFFGAEPSSSQVSDPYLELNDKKVTRVRIMVHSTPKEDDPKDQPADEIPCFLPLFSPIRFTEWPYLHLQSKHAMFIKPSIVEPFLYS